VELSWSYPMGDDGYSEDPRWATLVERRQSGGTLWRATSPWLPRGTYTFEDIPPDLMMGWEYRLRVRDHLGQVAASLPSITLPVMP
jgi:hypothetical protein